MVTRAFAALTQLPALVGVTPLEKRSQTRERASAILDAIECVAQAVLPQ